MKELLKKLWWFVTGKCPKCGGELEVMPVDFGDWQSYCPSCRTFFERL